MCKPPPPVGTWNAVSGSGFRAAVFAVLIGLKSTEFLRSNISPVRVLRYFGTSAVSIVVSVSFTSSIGYESIDR